MDNEKKDLIEKKQKKTKRKKIKKTKFKPVEGSSRKNLILIAVAVLAVIIISAAIFMTLTSLFSTEEYYVLNTNVKAKQEITSDMVVSRETAAGTGPVNALTMEEIQRGGVYSKYPLYAGDVVSLSNSGPLSGQALGIPDDWIVTSFSISTNDAVGGTLGKGDYVDIIGINDSGANYIFNNVLILEVKFVNEEYDGNLDGQTVIGEVMHYTVGMPADKVAYLHSALHHYQSDWIKIVKSPHIINYADRDVSDLDALFKYGPEIGNIDLIKGTDPTFTDVERDEDGRPINDFIEIDDPVNVVAPDVNIDIENETIENEVDQDNLDQDEEIENIENND